MASPDDKLPDDDTMGVWLHSYLECRAEMKGLNPEDVTDDDVKNLIQKVKIFRVV